MFARSCVFSIALFAGVDRAAAEPITLLWGVQPATNQIVLVDPLTGATSGGFTPPGGPLTAPNQIFAGLTIAEGGRTLLYQNPFTNPTDLFRINPYTATLKSIEFLPPAGNPVFRAGLSYESGVGTLGRDAVFAINNGAPIQRQDGYGNPTLVDHTGVGARFGGALGGDDHGRQFAVFENGIVEFDPAIPLTVLATLPLPTLDNSGAGGMAYDGDRLFYSTLGGELFTLDADTGEVLSAVTVDGGLLSGLAATRVPEPAAAGLLAAAAVAITRRRGASRRAA